MHRRDFLATSVLTAAAAALPAFAQPAGPDAELRTLFDDFFARDLDRFPERATVAGLDVGARAGARSRLDDYSAAGRAAYVDELAQRLARMERIDLGRLNTASRIDYDVIRYQYDRRVKAERRFRYGDGLRTPYAVSQLSGPYREVPDFLDSNHPVKVAPDAEAYLARLAQYPTALDASTADLRSDAAKGVLAPDFDLDAALAQLNKARASAPDDNGLVQSLARKTAKSGVEGNWQARAARIVAGEVYPALDRQIAAVTTLRARATHDAGVWKLPDGEAFYIQALAFATTTDRSPADIHALGLAQVAELGAKLDGELRAQGLTQGGVGERLAALSRRPDQLHANTDAGRAELLASLNSDVVAIRARLPRAFATLPAAPLEIVRVPPSIEEGSPNGYATPASLDGTRPGRFYINLKDTSEWPKFTLPTLAYHEALPGHQWQGAIARGSTEIPLLRRVGLPFPAYSEGWALYSEQLADELGAYDDNPLGRIGLAQSLLFRAVRLVVDTGIHAMRWSRERATDYMTDVTGLPRGRNQREIDRYTVWPGQPCSYKVGHTEWLRLRDEAKTKAGARFDLKRFHEVLRQGSMPLTVLARAVHGIEWA